jgi:hypothetical protein
MRRYRWGRFLVFLIVIAVVVFIGVVFGVRTGLDVTAPSTQGQVVRVSSGGRSWVRFVIDQGQACENDLKLSGSVKPGQILVVRYYPRGFNPCGNSWDASDHQQWVGDVGVAAIMAFGVVVLVIGWRRRDEIDRRWAAQNPWLPGSRRRWEREHGHHWAGNSGNNDAEG